MYIIYKLIFQSLIYQIAKLFKISWMKLGCNVHWQNFDDIVLDLEYTILGEHSV